MKKEIPKNIVEMTRREFDALVCGTARRTCEVQLPRDLYFATPKAMRPDLISAETERLVTIKRDYEQRCFEVSPATIGLGKQGSLRIASSASLIPELSYGSTVFELRHSRHINRDLKGVSASILGTRRARKNYGHWLIDAFSRLELIWRNVAPQDIDYYLVPKLTTDFHWDSLKLAGIPKDKLVELDVNEVIRCETVIATTKPRGENSSIVPKWILDFLNSTLAPMSEAKSPTEKIYVSRIDSGNRGVVNETEVSQFLKEKGFKTVVLSEFPIAKKIMLFQNASYIVGLSGAGLTNLAFASNKAKVLELFPSNYIHYFFRSICFQKGVSHKYAIFSNKWRGLRSIVSSYRSNVKVDLKVLENQLSLL